MLSGAHNQICPRVMELVREHGLDDVLVVVGGIIPDVDVPRLQEMGIRGIFRPGSADEGHRRVHRAERPDSRRNVSGLRRGRLQARLLRGR